jgi:hypothetical protein
MYLPNRELLSFLVVFALPIDSMIGLEAKTLFSIVELMTVEEPDELDRFIIEEDIICEDVMSETSPQLDEAMLAKYLMANFADTVFPAPDSPETMRD